MKMIVDLTIVAETGGGCSLWREFPLTITPVKGMRFESSGIDGGREIASVTLNPEEDHVYVKLQMEKVANSAERQQRVEYAKEFGWKEPHKLRQ